MGQHDFCWALRMLMAGCRVSRTGWNGKGIWIVFQAGYPEGIPINANTAKATGIQKGTVCRFQPYAMIRAADGSFAPWSPSQADLFSDDWENIDALATET
jgi:hypothetical protein